MEPEDYRLWNKYQKAVKNRQRTSHGHWEVKLKTEEEEAMEQQLFEAVSKRAWTDICLQLLKVHCAGRLASVLIGVLEQSQGCTLAI